MLHSKINVNMVVNVVLNVNVNVLWKKEGGLFSALYQPSFEIEAITITAHAYTHRPTYTNI
jgi:hypothetical protein